MTISEKWSWKELGHWQAFRLWGQIGPSCHEGAKGEYWEGWKVRQRTIQKELDGTLKSQRILA